MIGSSVGQMHSQAQYNPLDKVHLGESVATALLKSPISPLGKLEKIAGAGVYAIYYDGPSPAYAPLVSYNEKAREVANKESAALELPIYVGKAIPQGGRRGGYEPKVDSEGKVIFPTSWALWKRLAEHAESLAAAKNLRAEHFRCRYLIVDDIWIPLAESVMIAKTRPVWNRVVDGFGNHDPGKGRYNQERSRWDTMHPGRTWVSKLTRDNPLTAEAIETLVLEDLKHTFAKPLNVTPAASVSRTRSSVSAQRT